MTLSDYTLEQLYAARDFIILTTPSASKEGIAYISALFGLSAAISEKQNKEATLKLVTEMQLRQEAQNFADSMVLGTPHDHAEFIEEKNYIIEYLIAKILNKDPYICFCDKEYPTRIADGKEICCDCEKPVN